MPDHYRTFAKVSGPHADWVWGINRGATYQTSGCLFLHLGKWSVRLGRLR